LYDHEPYVYSNEPYPYAKELYICVDEPLVYGGAAGGLEGVYGMSSTHSTEPIRTAKQPYTYEKEP